MDNTSLVLYIPVKINNGTYEYVLDSNNKVRFFTTKEKLIKKVKNYDYIYVYNLMNRVR